ncbi:hypothetical protein AB0F46_18655 [Streptomyces sp. NPDC026665]|uniref:hypothetical protein n=1 Tax=Streptomyces sp. NPDC026665 TaxID=3154798 RepID=UPI0033D7531D
MSTDQLIAWTAAHGAALLAAGVLLVLATGLAGYIAHRASGTVLAASIGALVCTGFSADTSWRFADHRLHMAVDERLWLFAAGDIVLIVCAVMARANKLATADEDQAGTPGVPGVMVWCIAGVQVIPAYSESGVVGGTVRAVFGPVMAALLWHLAMGLEIRVARPEALSSGLPAQIGHELRERLLSYLGLAARGRTAVEISRDRATARAVRLAARRHRGWWARAALKASVARSGAATNGDRRHTLLQQVAARRTAMDLATVPVTSPWAPEPVPDPYPRTPLGVTGAELRSMDPLDAVLQVRAAHPDLTHAELASVCTEYGVPVSPTQVLIAVRTRTCPPVPAVPVDSEPEQPGPAAAPPGEPEPEDVPVPEEPQVPVPDTIEHGYGATGLHLDVTTEPEVRREFACAVPAAHARTRRTRPEVHARVPDVPRGSGGGGAARLDELADGAQYARREAETADRTRTPDPVPGEPRGPVPVPRPAGTGTGGADDVPALLARARAVDAAHRGKHGRPAGIQTLKKELGVGQPKATAIRAALDGRQP